MLFLSGLCVFSAPPTPCPCAAIQLRLQKCVGQTRLLHILLPCGEQQVLWVLWPTIHRGCCRARKWHTCKWGWVGHSSNEARFGLNKPAVPGRSCIKAHLAVSNSLWSKGETMWKGYQQDQELSQLSMGSGKPSVAGKLLSWLWTQPGVSFRSFGAIGSQALKTPNWATTFP